MNTRTGTIQRPKVKRQMLSVTTTTENLRRLNRLAAESGMSRKRLVNIGIIAIADLSPTQRVALNRKWEGEK